MEVQPRRPGKLGVRRMGMESGCRPGPWTRSGAPDNSAPVQLSLGTRDGHASLPPFPGTSLTSKIRPGRGGTLKVLDAQDLSCPVPGLQSRPGLLKRVGCDGGCPCRPIRRADANDRDKGPPGRRDKIPERPFDGQAQVQVPETAQATLAILSAAIEFGRHSIERKDQGLKAVDPFDLARTGLAEPENLVVAGVLRMLVPYAITQNWSEDPHDDRLIVQVVVRFGYGAPPHVSHLIGPPPRTRPRRDVSRAQAGNQGRGRPSRSSRTPDFRHG